MSFLSLYVGADAPLLKSQAQRFMRGLAFFLDKKKDRPERNGLYEKLNALRSANFCFCSFNNLGEASRIVNSDLRKHLAVEVDASLGTPVDKAAITDTVHAACSIDADNPESAEAALLHFSVHISHSLCPIYGFCSLTEEFTAGTTEAFSKLQAVVSSAA